MGVRGLQTFLKNNERHLATSVNLSDTCLIIDANNLMCRLYAISRETSDNPHNRDDVYGGDLVVYGRTVRQFFDSLKACSIEATLVFDGSVMGKATFKEFSGPKERESRKRGAESFERMKALNECAPGEELLLPQTINIVFRNVAQELKINKFQAPYEADAHVARLANERQCPVLTNDSDFIIYDLAKGFILIDHFRFRDIQNKTIRCTMFSQSKLTAALPGLHKEVMPLLSVLLGNDYVESGTFDQLLKTIGKGNPSGKFVASTYNHRRINSLLNWLQYKSVQEAIDFILRQSYDKTRLEKIIRLFMEYYRISSVEDLEQELKRVYPQKVTPKQQELNVTPVHFLKHQMEQLSLGSVALDMIFGNTHYGYTTIDDFDLPISSVGRYRAYSLALALLKSDASDKTAWKMYDRVLNSYGMMEIKPMEFLDSFDCYWMIQMEPEWKRNMLMTCFHVTEPEINRLRETVACVLSDSFADEATLLFVLIKFNGIESKLAPEPQFVTALMLTLCYYAPSNKEFVGDYDEAAAILGSYTRSSSLMDRDASAYRRIMHYLSQLHNNYKGYCLVNSLLSCPFHIPRIEKFLNSALVFRLTKSLRRQEEKLVKFIAGQPKLSEVCQSIQDQVLCAVA